MERNQAKRGAVKVNLDAFTARLARELVGLDTPSVDEHLQETLSLCDHHDVLPLFGYRLRGTTGGVDTLAANDTKRIETAERENRMRHTLAISALKDALAVLPVQPVLFKGLAAAQVWPQATLRDPGDLDLLVGPEGFLAAKRALLDNGWIEQPTVHGFLDEAVSAKYGFARVFRHPNRPVTIDLHREPVDATEPFRLDPRRLVESAVMTDIGEGVMVAVPGPVEHLGLIALHAVRHGTFRLQGFLDTYWWLDQHKDTIQDIEIRRYAKENKVFRALSVSIEVTRNLFGKLPAEINTLSGGRAVLRAASRRSPAVLVHSHMAARGGVRRVAALVDLIDDPVLTLRYLFRLAFPQREIMDISARKSFFFYLLQRVKTFLRLLQSFER